MLKVGNLVYILFIFLYAFIVVGKSICFETEFSFIFLWDFHGRKTEENLFGFCVYWQYCDDKLAPTCLMFLNRLRGLIFSSAIVWGKL